jgi:hypothetical protein
MKKYFEIMQSKADRYTEEMTSNLAELYASIRTKLDGGKIKNLIQKGTFNLVCIVAALIFNLGPTYIYNFLLNFCDIYNPILLERCKKQEANGKKDKKRKQENSYTDSRLKKKLFHGKEDDSESYGKKVIDPNELQILKQDLKIKSIDFLKNLYKESQDFVIKPVTQSQQDES